MDKRLIGDAVGHNIPGSDERCSASRPASIRYRPLLYGEIRVLCLWPGTFGSPLRGHLEHVRLDVLTGDKKSVFVDKGQIGDSSLAQRVKVEIKRNSMLDVFASGSGGYKTISYAWGERTSSQALHVEYYGSLPITQSLFEAFQHFRLANQVRRLWADSVCISQSNIGELSAQVKYMPHIYADADRVLVWLGPATASDALAFKCIQANPEIAECKLLEANPHLLGHPAFSYGPYKDLEYRRRHWSALIQSSPQCSCCQIPFDCSDDAIPEAMAAFKSLSERPWFSRLWVVQEVASNYKRTRVHCGHHHVGIENIASMLHFLNRLGFHDYQEQMSFVSGLPRTFLSKIELLRQSHFGKCATFNFIPSLVLGTLVELHHLSCSDPLDRVFAIRHILGIQEQEFLAPNYALDANELYRRLALIMLSYRSQDRNGDPLCNLPYAIFAMVGTESSPCPGAFRCSWVPNFHSFTQVSFRKFWIYRHWWGGARGCGQIQSTPLKFRLDRCDLESRTIRVRGNVFGTVAEVRHDCSTPFPIEAATTSLEERLGLIAEWYRRCRRHANSHFQPAVDHQLLALLTRGLLFHEAIKEAGLEFGGVVDTVRLNFQKLFPDIREREREPCAQSLTYLFRALSPSKHHKSLEYFGLLTDGSQKLCIINCNGKIGLGWVPKTAEAGDNLCLFSGAPYPFVLRPSSGGGYMLLGDAYTTQLNIRQAFGCEAETAAADVQDEPFLDWRTEDEDFGEYFTEQEQLPGYENIDWDTVNPESNVKDKIRVLVDRMGFITLN